jgi:(E)-4-hydroxy-3-methylbut-2-enyl-diphosphate synthase
MKRRLTPTIFVGPIPIGSKHPIVIQSMTNTPTSDVTSTVRQINELYNAGSELVRLTINDDAAMKAIPKIISQLERKKCLVPLIGDFHFNGHELLSNHPQSAKLLSKYRINPGNVDTRSSLGCHFKKIITLAIKNKKPIRIGVNSGSIDQAVLSRILKKSSSIDSASMRKALIAAMVQSALNSARQAQQIGLAKNKIILSVKMSSVEDTINAYEQLARRCDLALHLGLTEAGSSLKGVVSSSSALAILLNKGIGDTIRVSLTPHPNFPRTYEIDVCKAILQSLRLRFFTPEIVSCPGCGRTQSPYFEKLVDQTNHYIQQRITLWKKKYPGVEKIKIAVMGCVVNGPGESKHADIGISLPGKQEQPTAIVFAKGHKINTLTGANIASQFFRILEKHIQQNF